jgi:hypothetical protein
MRAAGIGRGGGDDAAGSPDSLGHSDARARQRLSGNVPSIDANQRRTMIFVSDR